MNVYLKTLRTPLISGTLCHAIGGDADKFYTSTIDEEYGNLLSESGSELYHLPDAQQATNAILDDAGEVVPRFGYPAHRPADGSAGNGPGRPEGGRAAPPGDRWQGQPAGNALATFFCSPLSPAPAPTISFPSRAPRAAAPALRAPPP